MNSGRADCNRRSKAGKSCTAITLGVSPSHLVTPMAAGPLRILQARGSARRFRVADYKSDRGIDVARGEANPDRPGQLSL